MAWPIRGPALSALPALAGQLTLQRLGHRPPGLPEAVRSSPQWEALRREIYTKGIRLQKGVTYDFRVLLTEARNARLAGGLMWQLIRPLSPEVLLGPGFGAVPLLFNIVNAALDEGVELQVLMVRDQRKGHNRKRWIEGNHAEAAGRRTVFIDDFMRRGSALQMVKTALHEEQLDVELVGAALFFDMWDPLVSRQLSVHAFPVTALYTRHDVGLFARLLRCSAADHERRPSALSFSQAALVALCTASATTSGKKVRSADRRRRCLRRRRRQHAMEARSRKRRHSVVRAQRRSAAERHRSTAAERWAEHRLCVL